MIKNCLFFATPIVMLITTLFGEQLLCYTDFADFRSFDRIKADKSGMFLRIILG